jgi:hypothetical protein
VNLEPFWREIRLALDKDLRWPPFNGPAKPFPKSLNGMHNDARRPILQIVPVLAGPVFRDGVRSSDEFELCKFYDTLTREHKDNLSRFYAADVSVQSGIPNRSCDFEMPLEILAILRHIARVYVERSVCKHLR